ncbi:MAG: hypothetical protein ACOVNU_04040 [Candidatus Kapaibacteriota bacterium]
MNKVITSILDRIYKKKPHVEEFIEKVGNSNESMQGTLEEAADLWAIDTNNVHPADSYIAKTSFIEGAKWQHKQDEIKYTERDVIEFADFIRNSPHVWIHRDKLNDRIPTKELLEIFKMK